MRSEARTGFSRTQAWATAVAALGLLCPVASGALAQASLSPNAVKHVFEDPRKGAVSLGDRGWSASEATGSVQPKEGATDTLEFSASVGVASDYIYRGTTLSDRKPAAGASFEVAFAKLYAGVAVATVKLPTEPSAEITLSSGIRPTLGNINFDFGLTYFLYPAEQVSGTTNGIDYWEAAARAETRIGESIRIAGGFAYAPNSSNTGAWSWYAAGGIGYDLPQRLLPKDVSVSFTGGGGY